MKHTDKYRRCALWIGVCLAAVTAEAQPRFVADNDILKVGEVEFQQPKTFTLPFTNKGNEPLVVTAVTPSCGCMKVSYTTTPIAPGKKGEVVVTYDARQLGTFYKDVELQTNASDKPTYMAIQGYVTRELTDYSGDFPIDLGNVRLNTDYIAFDDVNKGDKPMAEVQLVNMERTAFRPQLMHVPAYMSVEYVPETVPPGKKGLIRVTLDSEQLPTMGVNQTSIYLARYMGDKVGHANEIAVSAVLLPDFSSLSRTDMANAPELYVPEPVVDLSGIQDKTKLSANVMLLNMGKSPLHFQQVQVFGKALSISLPNSTLNPGKSTKLKVTVTRKALETEKMIPRILLITNDPAHPKQIIEVKTK
ncbi:MAG: DUF1573 domain-containing protein [Bacteroidaceae bacterium]|nr:DUF1573 domain-containing protein [Bacteroidaceae bacterium]